MLAHFRVTSERCPFEKDSTEILMVASCCCGVFAFVGRKARSTFTHSVNWDNTMEGIRGRPIGKGLQKNEGEGVNNFSRGTGLIQHHN